MNSKAENEGDGENVKERQRQAQSIELSKINGQFR